jgi:putative copper export protein
MAISFEVLLQLHLFAVAFWLGIVAVEYLLERTRAQTRNQGFSVARLPGCTGRLICYSRCRPSQ